MNRNRSAIALSRVFAFLMLLAAGLSIPALADTGTSNAPLTDPNQGTSWDIRKNWSLRNKLGAAFLPTSAGGTDSISNGSSTGPGVVMHGPGPVQMWPMIIPTAVSTVPSQRDTGISKNLMTTFGYPLSDTQFQIIGRMNDNIKMEQESDPERNMWQQTTQSSMQAGSAANSAAGMTTNQGQSAIQFQQKFLKNFTSEAGNRWLVIRDQLFIPIAVLLLLPGAVLCQVKSIIAQGSNILGETSPFEGIFRSIIAIFMIPGTLLVINYGIDVSNSVHFTIADEYTRIFGTDMYHDAQCALWRAFPVNSGNSNNNSIQAGADTTQSQGASIFSTFEALNLDVRQYDPCAGLDNSLVPDENQSQNKLLARLMLNGMNVGLSGSWNILCAFQEAFLFYLFCMGPIAAALWVWPVKSLRSALGSWCEGVMILCFWSLFWNTCVLLMACFRGVSETGTVIMTALLFLSTIVTQYAFDFVGLVTSGASSGVQSAMQNAASAASQSAGGGGKGGGQAAQQGGKGGTQHRSGTGPNSTHGGTGAGTVNPATNAGGLTPRVGTAGPGGTIKPGGANVPTGTNPGGGIHSPTAVPPSVGGGAFPLKTSDVKGTGDPSHGGPPGSALGPITPGGPGGAGGNIPPLGQNDGIKGGATNNAGSNLASLHVNSDGSLAVNNTHGGPLTADDKKHLAEQTNQLNNAMQSHDAKTIGQMAGPGASAADVNQLAQHGSLSAATMEAAKGNGAGFAVGSDGRSLVSATGVPGGMNTSPEHLGVNGVHNLSPNGMEVGGPMNGGTGIGSTMSKDGFQGQMVPLQAGQDYVGASHDQISQLAKENHIDPSQMSMLVGQNGKAEITGPNGTPLANIHDGNMYAPGVGNHASMDANGQWTATSTGTPLTHDGSMGSSFQVAGSAATFDSASGNFSANGHSMSATDFAKNPPDGVTAHMPGANGTGGANEFHAPSAPTGNMVPEGVNPQAAFGAQAVGTEGPPGGNGQMQGLAGLAQHEGANSFNYSNQGGQLYAEANGHQIAHFDASHQQWVASGESASGSHVVLNQGQFDHTGTAAQQTHGQWVDAGNPTHTMAQDSGSNNWHQAAAGNQTMTGYEGGQHTPTTGNGPTGGNEYAQQGVSSAPIAGMDAAHSHSFQQMAANEGLTNAQMAPGGHQITGTDHAGHQQVLANENGGQWTAAQQYGGGALTGTGGDYAQQASAHAPIAGLDAAQSHNFQQMATSEGLHNAQMAPDGHHIVGTDQSGHQHTLASESGGQWTAAQQYGGGALTGTGGDYAQQASAHAPIAGLDAAQSQNFQQMATSEGLHNAQMAPDGHHIVGTDQSGHQHTLASESGGQWTAAQQYGGGALGGTGGGDYAQQASAHAPIAGLDAAQNQNFQQMATSEGLHNAQMAPDGHHIVGTDQSGHQQTLASESGGQWTAAQQYGGGALGGTGGTGGNDYAQQASASAPIAGMDAAHSHSFQQLASSEGMHNAQMAPDGHHIMATDSSGHQHNIASENGGQWSAGGHSGGGQQGGSAGSPDVVMNNQGQWVAPGSSTPLESHAGANGSVNWSAQGAPEVSYNAQTHMMSSGGYSAPAASVTPDMVSNIHNSHNAESLAMAGNAGQQVQNLSNQEHAGNVHTQYDAQHNLQAVGGDNNQVVANYNSSEHRWEAAGSSGQVVQNQAGDWVANNSTVNALSSQEHAGQVHVQADGHGNFQAVGQNNQVVASTDGGGNWTSPQAQQIADQMGAGQTHLARDMQGHVESVTASGGVVASYDQGSSTASHNTSSGGGWSAGDTSVQNMSQQMNAGPTHIAQDAQGHVHAVGATGQTVANYDSSSQTWSPAQTDNSVQHMSNQMHAGATHVTQNEQGQVQAVGQNGQVVANYDTTNHHWSPAQANEGVQHLASQMHAGTAHVAQNDQGQVQAVGQNGQVVANYDTTAQRWETQNGNVVQDNNQNWVANNQYVNSSQETPVQYNPQQSYSQGSSSSDQAQWSASAAPDLAYNNGTFSTTYGDNSPALSMPASNMTPDLANYVQQNPQQVEGLQNLAHHENLQGPVQFQTTDQGQVQATASGQEFASNSGQGWVADNSSAQAPAQPTIERNDGSWVSQDSHHTQAHTSDGHALSAQAEPQMHSAPPTSSHPNPTIASTGIGAGAAALGAWGAMKKQNAMNTPPSTPKPAQAQPQTPTGPEATAQNTSLDPQQQHLREESEKKRRAKLKKLLEEQGPFGGDDGRV